MRIVVSLLGVEVLSVCTDKADAAEDQPGDITTYPLGFVGRVEVPFEADVPDRDL